MQCASFHFSVCGRTYCDSFIVMIIIVDNLIIHHKNACHILKLEYHFPLVESHRRWQIASALIINYITDKAFFFDPGPPIIVGLHFQPRIRKSHCSRANNLPEDSRQNNQYNFFHFLPFRPATTAGQKEKRAVIAGMTARCERILQIRYFFDFFSAIRSGPTTMRKQPLPSILNRKRFGFEPDCRQTQAGF